MYNLQVSLKISFKFANLATDFSDKLNVLRHNGDSASMKSAQVGIFEEID
jgi:hypothetical protein